jgi:hypothetical protein
MNDVSTLRLYLLRGMYLLIGIGMGSIIWPILVQDADSLQRMHAVAVVMLAALSLLCLLGLRYPLQMLPLLLFELAWKTIWMLAVALPRWQAGTLTGPHFETTMECLLGVILVPIVIPWGYVWRNYVRRPAARWRAIPHS